jgi:hypothetical protein
MITVRQEIDIATNEWWGGGEETIRIVKAAGKIRELEALIAEMYPEGIDETGLNDLFRFDDDFIFSALGINPDGCKDEEE